MSIQKFKIQNKNYFFVFLYNNTKILHMSQCAKSSIYVENFTSLPHIMWKTHRVYHIEKFTTLKTTLVYNMENFPITTVVLYEKIY